MNRQNVKRIIETVLFIRRPNIAFCGHDEHSTSLNKGNFYKLYVLHRRAKDLPELKSHLPKSVHYASPQSQNEIICMIGKVI